MLRKVRIVMEIIELPITIEESENYRKITNRLKILGAIGWVKAYIWAVVYVVIFCAIGFMLAGKYALGIMEYVPVWVWPVLFIAVWIVSAKEDQVISSLRCCYRNIYLLILQIKYWRGRYVRAGLRY